MPIFEDCEHAEAMPNELGRYWCPECQTEYAADGSIVYQEPTAAQLEALNNPDSGPSDSHYRDAMRDAGRGGLLA